MGSSDFLNPFKPDNWNKLSIQQREDAYQNLENEMATREGRAPRTISYDFNMSPYNCGYFDPNNDSINLNGNYLNGNMNYYDGMDTVIHEGRHAYQHDCTKGLATPDEKMQPHLAGINDSFLSGVYRNDSPYYRMMPCERDAHSYACETMASPEFMDKLGMDPAYTDNIEDARYGIDKYDSILSDDLDNKRDNLSDEVDGKKDKFEQLDKDPNISSDDKLAAYNDWQDSREKLGNLNSVFDQNGNPDVDKAADYCAHQEALNNGYSEDMLNARNSGTNFDKSNSLGKGENFVDFDDNSNVRDSEDKFENEERDKENSYRDFANNYDTQNPLDNTNNSFDQGNAQTQKDDFAMQDVSDDQNQNNQQTQKDDFAMQDVSDDQNQNYAQGYDTQNGAYPDQGNQNQMAGTEPTMENDNNGYDQNDYSQAGAEPSRDNDYYNDYQDPYSNGYEGQTAGAEPSNDEDQDESQGNGNAGNSPSGNMSMGGHSRNDNGNNNSNDYDSSREFNNNTHPSNDNDYDQTMDNGDNEYSSGGMSM